MKTTPKTLSKSKHIRRCKLIQALEQDAQTHFHADDDDTTMPQGPDMGPDLALAWQSPETPAMPGDSVWHGLRQAAA